MLVCLDPGHGGYDPGAIGPSGLREKDVNLEVALKAGSYLERAKVGVIFTRKSDQVPWPADKNKDLAARCEIANKAGADLFVSVHCNGASEQKANGTETYSFSDTGPGADAAKLVQAELLEALKLRDRGAKTAKFYVLRHTVMPAVLTELAFISNPQEEQLLALPGTRTNAARAIARAVARHFGVELPEEEPRLVINGQPAPGVPFKIVDGKTWVELRSFIEVIGGTVQWDEQNKTINVTIS